MIAVILAAGRGTRMGALTATTAKPLLHLRGRPILEHIIRGLRAAGVREIVVVTGYRGEQIEAFFGDGMSLDVHLAYRRQEQAGGTAQALLLVRDLVGTRPFLLSWGDIVVAPENYRALVQDFAATPCDTLLMVNATDDPWRGAAVDVDASGRVTRIVEKPPPGASTTPWNNAGVFIFAPLIFAFAEQLPLSARGEYELPQAVGAMVAAGHRVRAHPVRGFWSDLGTAADLEAAEREFLPEGGVQGNA